MVAQFRRILMVAVLLSLPAACADDELAGPETTLEEAQDACFAYAEASCRKFASCRGDDEAAIDGCLTLASDRCARQVEDNNCWEGLRAGYEDCLSVEDAACEDLCDQDGVCIYSCFFEECVSGP